MSTERYKVSTIEKFYVEPAFLNTAIADLKRHFHGCNIIVVEKTDERDPEVELTEDHTLVICYEHKSESEVEFFVNGYERVKSGGFQVGDFLIA